MIINTKTTAIILASPILSKSFQFHGFARPIARTTRTYSAARSNIGDSNNGNKNIPSVVKTMNTTGVSYTSAQMNVERDMIVDEMNVEASMLEDSEDVVAADALALSGIDETDNAFSSSSYDPLQNTTIESSNILNEEAYLEVAEKSSVRGILKFAIPAIGVWLCSPLLSLIDTSAVGLLSGTSDQAALNPATTLTDYSALLLAFLYTATTNLASSAMTADRKKSNDLSKPSTLAIKNLITSINFSAFVGAGLGVILFSSASFLLRCIMVNGDGLNMDVFNPALRYVQIRSLGMPAAAIIGSAQAACLGMKDVNAPLIVLVAAALVNLLGDFFLVGQKHPWIGGASGAAWATVISQYTAVAFFFRWFLMDSKKKVKENKKEYLDWRMQQTMDISDGILKLSDKRLSNFKEYSYEFDTVLAPSKNISKAKRLIRGMTSKSKIDKRKDQDDTESTFSTKGFLTGHFKKRSVLQIPRKSDIVGFIPYVLPCTMTGIGRVSTYIAMNFVVANALSTTDMAAQVIILSFFNCICMLADALNMTAQSFVPTVFEQAPSEHRLIGLKTISRDFAKASSIFGFGMISIVATIPFLVKCFTTDPTVISTVISIVPLLMINFSVHGFVCAGEGILLGQKDLTFLGRAFASFFAIVPWIMIQSKTWFGKSLVLLDLWKIFVLYNLTRCSVWIGRILLLERRNESKFRLSKSSSGE